MLPRPGSASTREIDCVIRPPRGPVDVRVRGHGHHERVGATGGRGASAVPPTSSFRPSLDHERHDSRRRAIRQPEGDQPSTLRRRPLARPTPPSPPRRDARSVRPRRRPAIASPCSAVGTLVVASAMTAPAFAGGVAVVRRRARVRRAERPRPRRGVRGAGFRVAGPVHGCRHAACRQHQCGRLRPGRLSAVSVARPPVRASRRASVPARWSGRASAGAWLRAGAVTIGGRVVGARASGRVPGGSAVRTGGGSVASGGWAPRSARPRSRAHR